MEQKQKPPWPLKVSGYFDGSCTICGRYCQGWIKEEAEKIEKARGPCPTPLDICPYCGKEVPPPRSTFEYYCLIAFRRDPDGDCTDSLNRYLTGYRERAKEYLEHGTFPQLKRSPKELGMIETGGLSTSENDPRGQLKTYREIKICSTCYDLYGFFDYWSWQDNEVKKVLTLWDQHDFLSKHPLYQKSKCQKSEVQPYSKWDGFDYNEIVTLCYCCGQEVIRSGSKYACWFCSDCRELLESIPSTYKVVIPTGRHSLMSAIIVKGQDILNNPDELAILRVMGKDIIDNPGEFTRWYNATKALFNRMDVLFEWRTHIMKENFKILGLTDDVLLFDYLSARDHLPAKYRAVKDLVEFFIAWEITRKKEVEP